MRVLAFGTYESDYPRNAMALEGLRRTGIDVDVCHEPLWESARHKAGAALSARALAGWAGSYARASRSLVRRTHTREADCILVGYPAHVDVPLARLVAGRRPVILNAMVSLSDTLVSDRARVGRRHPGAYALRAIDRTAFALSDRIILDTQAHADWLVDAFDLPPEKVTAVPVGAEDVFRPARGSTDSAAGGAFTVLFYGKLIPLHGLEFVLQAALDLMSEGVKFKIVGQGQLESWLGAEIRRLGLANVEHVQWIDYGKLPSVLAQADVALGIFGTGSKGARVVPNKAFQAVACARPLITADTPAAREYFVDGRDAMLVPSGSGTAIATAIRALRDDPALRARVGSWGRSLFVQRFTTDRLGEAYAQVIRQTVEGHGKNRADRPGAGARWSRTVRNVD